MAKQLKSTITITFQTHYKMSTTTTPIASPAKTPVPKKVKETTEKKTEKKTVKKTEKKTEKKEEEKKEEKEEKKEEKEEKEEKPKKLTLPAKYKKFVQFSFFLMKKMNADAEEPFINEQKFMDLSKMYDGAQAQIEFVDLFLNDKTIVKEMKKNSPEELAKLAAKNAKAQAKLDKIAASNAAKLAKAQAKKDKLANKRKDHKPQDNDLVAQIVSLANNNLSAQTNENDNHNHNDNDDDDDDELDVEVFKTSFLDFDHCLVDKDFNAFHPTLHHPIGKIINNALILN